MAHLVKTKISIISGSILVVVLISALQVNFWATPTIKRWDDKYPLTWIDFQGIPVPFSQWGATISSSVYLDYDSTLNRYVAYVGQNNMRSWTRFDDEYMLKHEQYHFNITELHARKLNRHLSKQKVLSLEQAEEKLKDIVRELDHNQYLYDIFTDHGLKRAKQNYWEFKIDSSLQEYSQNKGLVTDHLSGLSARFYKEPDFFSTQTDTRGIALRGYEMTGYEMLFVASSYKYIDGQGSSISDFCMTYSKTDTANQLTVSYIPAENQPYCEATKLNKDQSIRIWERFYQYGGDFYYASVEAPNESTGREYNIIKDRFFNSISFSETKEYWISKADSANQLLSFTKSATTKAEDEGEGYSVCVSIDADNIFFKPPFFDEKGDLYIAYDIVADSEDSVLYNIALINRANIFDWKVNAKEQLLVLPDSLLPKESFGLEFGYVLKKDSLKECFYLYKQSGTVNINK
ncbi:hypothetical protein D770_04810 [Flammeovirgaceae bacterium 311]|nr:hypothetical protein D770_04810 [Flammeovirgaceae bacterium 311]